MGETTKIQWTDRTFNGWWGCSKVHTGCTHCYAEAFSKRTGRAKWGDSGSRLRTSDSNWRQPLKWNKEAEKSGIRQRVFCSSMADVFENWSGPVLTFDGEDEYRQCLHCGWFGNLPVLLPQMAKRTSVYHCPKCDNGNPTEPITLDTLRRHLFALIDATPWLDWQLLTKRPENVRDMWVNGMGVVNPAYAYRKNVWIGTSVSNQETTTGIDALLECRDLCPVLFLSVEPLVGRLDLGLRNWPEHRLVDWVIVGGESGAGARPCDVGDVRFIVEDCARAGVPVFVKQLGSLPILPVDTAEQHRDRAAEIYSWPDGTHVGNRTRNEALNGRVLYLKDNKGGDQSEWPESLRVREFPKAKHCGGVLMSGGVPDTESEVRAALQADLDAVNGVVVS